MFSRWLLPLLAPKESAGGCDNSTALPDVVRSLGTDYGSHPRATSQAGAVRTLQTWQAEGWCQLDARPTRCQDGASCPSQDTILSL